VFAPALFFNASVSERLQIELQALSFDLLPSKYAVKNKGQSAE
jgi:hypothetical protein